jgi:hypothetical protein
MKLIQTKEKNNKINLLFSVPQSELQTGLDFLLSSLNLNAPSELNESAAYSYLFVKELFTFFGEYCREHDCILMTNDTFITKMVIPNVMSVYQISFDKVNVTLPASKSTADDLVNASRIDSIPNYFVVGVEEQIKAKANPDDVNEQAQNHARLLLVLEMLSMKNKTVIPVEDFTEILKDKSKPCNIPIMLELYRTKLRQKALLRVEVNKKTG